MAKQLSESERQRIAEALRAGKPRNQVARESGRGLGTVTAIAQAEGIALDRSATKKATDARVADVRSRLSELMGGLAEDAHRFRGELFSAGTSPQGKLALMTCIGIAVDKTRALLGDVDEKEGLSAVDNWLEDLIRRSRT